MKHLIVMLLSVFVLVSVVHAENPEQIAGQPFVQINKKLDLTNEKIEAVKEQLEETKKNLRQVAEFVTGLKSGARHWVSPYWDARYQNIIMTTITADRTRKTLVRILNGNFFQSVNVTVNIYYWNDIVRKSYEREIPPKSVDEVLIAHDMSEDFYGTGWVEVIADNDVFVSGHIETRQKHNYDTDLSYSYTAMTWYRSNAEN